MVLRKPAKDDYTQPKSYRPIALLNTLGKALEPIIANRLTYLVDTYLPKRHTGGRKLASTDHAIHLLLQRIHRAWADGKVASLLLLDEMGAATWLTIRAGKIQTRTLLQGPQSKYHPFSPPSTRHDQGLDVMPIPWHSNGLPTPMGPSSKNS